MPPELTQNWAGELSLISLLINLGIGVFLSIIVRWHFKRFGSTLSNREEFAQVFPLILLTTILIITVVKSSLALSLGLVGALSIVRFRTPIKEPEELAYLFITIAMGLGLGANQTIATVVSGVGILGVMALLKWLPKESANKNLYLTVDLPGKKNENTRSVLDQLNALILKHAKSCDLKRYDFRSESIEANYLLDIAGTEKLNSLVNDLNDTFSSIGVTFLDQNQLLNI